tara:strand:+ start:407 stop:598 length:192 start_codon:yes stop_codon:yes gene_type:complete
MKVKVSRVAKKDGNPIAFTVKVRGRKYPIGLREWYFPHDNKPETAIEMAILDYKRELLKHEVA